MTTRRFFTPAALITLFGSSAFAQEAAPAPEATPAVEQAPADSSPDAVVSDGGPEVSSTPDAAPSTPEAAPPAPPPAPLAPPPPGRAREPDVDAIEEAEASEPDDGLLGSHQTHYTLQFGVRTAFISNPGFDLFSEDDVYAQVSFGAGRVLIAEGPLSVAALVGWDFGKTESTVRGAKSDFNQHRLWLGGEVRYHVLRRLYAFVRLAPALLNTQASLKDPIAQAEREAGGWGFGADGSAGAAFEVLGKASGQSSHGRGWVTADGGYGWTESEGLSFSASEDVSAPTRTASLDLGDLALRGGFFRVGVAVTF
jgi:hypothetical protein